MRRKRDASVFHEREFVSLFQIVVIFGYFLMSYMLSLVVSLGFEAPTIALLNILHPIKRKTK
jgi:hypothetical protein